MKLARKIYREGAKDAKNKPRMRDAFSGEITSLFLVLLRVLRAFAVNPNSMPFH